MQPLGYLYKKIKPSPEWLNVPSVQDIYSVCDHISENFADYTNYWRHNGFWLFDSPKVIEQLAQENSISLQGLKLFYYEGFEKQFIDSRTWVDYQPEKSFQTQIIPPINKRLEGFDIVTFSGGNAPECSPLSCNAMAKSYEINSHCLFGSFKNALEALKGHEGDFGELGPNRIIAVYSVGDGL